MTWLHRLAINQDIRKYELSHHHTAEHESWVNNDLPASLEQGEFQPKHSANPYSHFWENKHLYPRSCFGVDFVCGGDETASERCLCFCRELLIGGAVVCRVGVVDDRVVAWYLAVCYTVN